MRIDPNKDPDKGEVVPLRYQALWPGAMAIMAGIDLLAKFFAGSNETGAGKRFVEFLECCSDVKNADDRDVIYQLRNSLLHSFGLYSEDKKKKKVYRFFLTDTGTDPLVSPKQGDRYYVDLQVLHREFEKAVKLYREKLNGDGELKKKFDKMFGNYGCIYIG